MLFVPIATLVLALATGLLLFAFAGLRALFGWRRPGLLRQVGLAMLLSVPIHAFVVVPGLLGYLGTHWVGTRGDERGYGGPRIGGDGEWILQSRQSLKGERDGGTRVDPSLLAAAGARAARLVSADGTPLRAFVVAAREPAPRATVVMVHGLYRCALELEEPGAMFRDLGCEVVLLEMRNHGGSGRAPATFGQRESDDVLAAVEWVRGRSAVDSARPLVLFGVSLGTAAVGLAAPRVERLAGVVVDAPMDDALSTARRMLAGGPRGRSGLAIPEPFRSLALTAAEMWGGMDLAAIQPAKALMSLPGRVPVLVIGGALDRRMPPDVVRGIYAALPQAEGTKALWICADAGHGDVWAVDGVGYREHLSAFLDRAAPR